MQWNRSLAILFAALLASVALAGCAEDQPADEEPAGDEEVALTADSYALELQNFPEAVQPGEAFTFQLVITGEPTLESDHIGAHYGTETATEPSTTVYPQACEHTVGVVPGLFDVTCEISEAGTYFLRGHLRVTVGEEQFNYWSDEVEFIAAQGAEPAEEEPVITEDTFTIEVQNFPETVTAGEAFTFQVAIAGDVQAESDHIGAHYGTETATEPSTTVYPQACEHTVGVVPGTFDVTCTVNEAGSYFLRGHLRITQDDQPLNFWGEEIAFEVAEPAAA